MIYNINNSSLKRVKNKGGGTTLPYDEYIKIFNLNKKHIQNLLHEFENLEIIGGKCVFGILYDELPPKKNRFIFNISKYPKNIDEIRQRTLRTNNELNDSSVEIYYEISEEEKEYFEQKVGDLFETSSYSKEKGELLLKVVKARKLLQNKSSANIKTTKIVGILYIESIVEKLIEDNVLVVGINYFPNQNFAVLNPVEFEHINNNSPWILMDVKTSCDFVASKIDIGEMNDEIELKNPNSIVVGVIDSGIKLPENFDQFVVGNIDCREKGVFSDYTHGSAVSSIIIANDELNPGQKDGLGNFSVKHFEFLEPYEKEKDAKLSFLHLMKKLPKILEENVEIKVWNLSFGALKEPYYPLVSEIGLFLDEMASTYGVIFVIASGNERQDVGEILKTLNAPADSLNGISVGSVTKKNENITYSDFSSMGRLVHFEKPEISHFGGPYNFDGSPLLAQKGNKVGHLYGTSFSTPRVSRLIAWFIHKEGLSPQEAKAKAISLAKRETPSNKSSSFGYLGLKSKYKVELKLTTDIVGNEPLYLPLNLPNKTTMITIASSSLVQPNKKFGEEHNISDVEISLIWYCTGDPNPEHNNLKTTVKKLKSNDNLYVKEKILRYEEGKYFNSKKRVHTIEDVNECLEILKNKHPNQNYEFAFRIKQLYLFNTDEPQSIKSSFFIGIEGDFDLEEFEKMNESVIDVEIEQEIDI